MRVNLRIEEGLWEWAGVYAEQRGVSRTAVVAGALATFRGLAKSGVPELEETPATDAGGGSGRVSKASVPASPRAPVDRARTDPAKRGGPPGKSVPAFLSTARPKGALSAALIERQARLNRAKEGG